MRARLFTLLPASLAGALLLAGCAGPAGGRAKSAPGTPGTAELPPVPAENWDYSLKAGAEQKAKAHAHFAAGISLELQEKSEEALAEFYQAGLADPANERLVLDVARRLVQARQVEKAAELLAAAARTPEPSASLLTLLGLVYTEQGKTDEAIEANRRALRLSPRVIAPYRSLVQLYLKKDNAPAALNTLDDASRLEGMPPEFLVELADLYAFYLRQRAGDVELVRPRMLQALDAVMAGKPENPLVLQKVAEGYQHLKLVEKSVEIYLDLVKRFPNLPGVRERLTNLYIQSGEKERARELLLGMVRDNPTRSAEAYYILAHLFRQDKQYGSAIEQLERMLIVKPEAEPVFYELSELHNLNNQPEKSLAVLDKAKNRFGESFVNRFYRAMTYNRLKQYDRAIEQLTAAEVMARAASPERLNHIFYFQLGSTHERNRNYEQAELYFEKCLALDPEFAEALNYLGYMWAERGEKLDRARELIEKALKLEPDNAAFLDSMAWVLFKQNEPRGALEWMLKAMKHVEEPDPTLYDHLGDIYAALKQYGKAREAWEKSLKIESSDEVKRKLESVPK